tara:strand:+ start:1954 stop:2259 length:306 start_codon:yes stop_codon:yes gene_type:complete
MQELINEASQKNSKAGILCYFFGLSGAVFSVGVLIMSLLEFGKPFSRPDQLFAIGATGLASSSALASFGTLAKNSERQTALLTLLISSQNSASELRVKKED